MTNRFLALAVFAGSLFFSATLARSAPVTSSTTPAAPPAPVITAVELHPAKTLLVQPCPVALVFHGDITTTRATSVTYTWVDSRGKTWPVHHRRLSLPGVSAVSHRWKVGKPGKMVDYWVQLKVIAPESMLSNKVPVQFTCAK